MAEQTSNKSKAGDGPFSLGNWTLLKNAFKDLSIGVFEVLHNHKNCLTFTSSDFYVRLKKKSF